MAGDLVGASGHRASTAATRRNSTGGNYVVKGRHRHADTQTQPQGGEKQRVDTDTQTHRHRHAETQTQSQGGKTAEVGSKG